MKPPFPGYATPHGPRKESKVRTAVLRTTMVAVLIAFLPTFVLAGGSPIRPLPGKLHPRLLDRPAKGEEELLVWIFFSDKEESGKPGEVSPEALERRARVGFDGTWGDLPLTESYVRRVEEEGGEIRVRSRWLNGVSARVRGEALPRIADLPFVIRIQEVARRAPAPVPAKQAPWKRSETALEYGLSRIQLELMNALPLLDMGLSGRGVRVLLMDSGFYTYSFAFDSTEIEDRYDFLEDDTSVEGVGEGHGSGTLSVIGGYDPGWIIGPAYRATYFIARTEDSTQEVPQEDWYEYEDMDGQTAVVTVAAQAAVDRGMVVVNSQGNEAFLPWHYLIAPADAPGVISVGAVNVNGDRAGFSSFGPTADGRIKPDVCALGTGVAGVDSPRSLDRNDLYSQGLSGTSFSAPLVAGACALLLEAHPILTPADVMERLKETASQSAEPDNELGWGIVDLFEAAVRPFVDHKPASDVSLENDTFHVSLTLSLLDGFDAPLAVVGAAGGSPDTVELAPGDDYRYSFRVESPEGGSGTSYYFLFTREGRSWTEPEGAPGQFYEFGDATAPSIAHTQVDGRFPLQEWPLLLSATVTDNASLNHDSVYVAYTHTPAGGGSPVTGSFSLSPADDSTFQGTFPFTPGAGDHVVYRIIAVDGAGNRAEFPGEGGDLSFTLYSVGYALRYGTEGDAGPTNPFLGRDGKAYPIIYDLPEEKTVRIRVYDAAGRLVREVWNAPRPAGARERIDWDGKDEGGRTVAPGVYFLRFEAGSFTATRKIVLLQ
jgi:serine protease AprX